MTKRKSSQAQRTTKSTKTAKASPIIAKVQTPKEDTIEPKETNYQAFNRKRSGVKSYHVLFAIAVILSVALVIVWKLSGFSNPMALPDPTNTPMPTFRFTTYTPLPTIEVTETLATETPMIQAQQVGIVTADIWLLTEPNGNAFACGMLTGYNVIIFDEIDQHYLVEYQPTPSTLLRGWLPMQFVRITAP